MILAHIEMVSIKKNTPVTEKLSVAGVFLSLITYYCIASIYVDCHKNKTDSA